MILSLAKNGNNEELERLLDSGADLNAKDNDGNTALMLSSEYSNIYSSIETVRLLLDRGADINAKNKSGRTALMLSSKYSYTTSSIETVPLLLDRGADVNAKSNGYTALMYASKYSNSTSSIETVRLLLDHGADVNAKTNYGRTALMFASLYSNHTSSIETVRLLLDRGADINAKIKDGCVALDFCPTEECRELINAYIWWPKLYARDKDTAKRFASNMNKPKLPKDIWEIILLYKRLEQLCSNLSNEKNKEILRLFAKEYGITITKEMNKAKLYELISKQLAYGKKY